MGKFTAQINRLWPAEADRKIAEAFCQKFDVPGMSERLPAMLQESASVSDRIAAGELSVEDGRSFLASFASEGIGVAPHHMADLTTWFDGPAPAEASAAPPAAEPEKPAAAQPASPAQAQPTPAPTAASPARPANMPVVGPTNVNNRISEIETKYMRAAPNTPEYKTYWLGESGQRMQQEYRDLVSARDTPLAMALPPMPAGGASSPAPAPAPAPPAETGAPA